MPPPLGPPDLQLFEERAGRLQFFLDHFLKFFRLMA
jgi:hypothetical protein